jgi:dissimilatory sulfite reductase (desulfoviridin) alpha/beta subunit
MSDTPSVFWVKIMRIIRNIINLWVHKSKLKKLTMFRSLSPDKIIDFLRKTGYRYFKEEELKIENTSTFDDTYINGVSKISNSVYEKNDTFFCHAERSESI